MLNVNRKQLCHSAQTKKDAAAALMKGPQTHPVPAVYLSHVALECALKLRILKNSRAMHLEDLKRLMPAVDFQSLFSGTTGHDLRHLERTAQLRRYLTAMGQAELLSNTNWTNMMGDGRPYSVRYGFESVKSTDAHSQVELAVRLAELILKSAA